MAPNHGSTPGSDPGSDLLIALNSSRSLTRPALYRLAEEAGRWAGPEPPARPLPRLAREIGVPRGQLEKALALLDAGTDRLARRERDLAAELGARLVTRLDADYPPALAGLSLAPPVLAVRGEVPAGPAVAIVGSRRADPYGREVAHLFAQALAERGVAIVSGFAVGIDAAAHRGALAAAVGGQIDQAGRTVAVLGCGLGVDYPAGHADLGREIAARGALVTEFPCGLAPRGWHFPVRNRVIAALAGGTLVVQAAARSGSLVTARHALDLGREVWAVPGRIFDERSLGPHALIRDGALLVQHPRDLLDVLEGVHSSTPTPLPGRPAREVEEPDPPGLPGAVLAALPRGAELAPEDLAGATGASVDRVLGALLELELAGRVRRMPGPVFVRV